MAPPAPTILILGDSVIHSMDVGILRAEFGANLIVPGLHDHFSRMYTSQTIPGSRFEAQTQSAVMPTVIEAWAPGYLVVQGSITDITEIRNQPPWAAKLLASRSAETLMTAVEQALVANPAIVTTVILDRPPRFDGKGPLSELANSRMSSLWDRSHQKRRICLGSNQALSLALQGHESTQDLFYGAPNSRHKGKKADGVHFRTTNGRRAYTQHVATALRHAGLPLA
jgi:hypothetical protein